MDEAARAGEAELVGDVGLHPRRRGGGERDDRRRPQRRQPLPEQPVVGAEIVSPLRDAVGLVDRHQRQRALRQHLGEARHAQPLGCDEEEVETARRGRRGRPLATRRRSRPEWMRSARSPSSLSLATWSSISAISGETTSVVPPRARPGSWKQSDLPAPVGMTSSTSCPAVTASQTASWWGRKACRWKRCSSGPNAPAGAASARTPAGTRGWCARWRVQGGVAKRGRRGRSRRARPAGSPVRRAAAERLAHEVGDELLDAPHEIRQLDLPCGGCARALPPTLQ